jgi:predicted PurR-regulated permease PerM
VSVLTPEPARLSHNPGSLALNILAFTAAVAVLYYGRVFLITVVIAVVIAFLLDPMVHIFMKLRLPRSFASFVVCSIAILFLYLIGLGLYTEIVALMDDLPAYSQRVSELVDQASAKIDAVERDTYQILVPKRYREPPPADPALQQQQQQAKSKRKRSAPEPVVPPAVQEVRIRPEPIPIFSYLYNYVRSFYSVMLMASFIPFLVYFMLSWRDHVRRSFLYLFNAADRQAAGRSSERVAEICRAYVLGNFILGCLLSVASTAFFVGMALPYAFLIGPVSGFLSLVPYVGVPLAIVPPLVAALAVYNQPTMYIVIALVVTLFHLLALNLLYPKVVGARVHLNPLVVTVALMFWGTIWGGVGLVLAIPITAAIKAVCDNVASLTPYGKLLGD